MRVYVLLLYRDFDDPKADVDVFVVPARDVQRLKAPWLGGRCAVYCSSKATRANLEKYRDAWHYV